VRYFLRGGCVPCLFHGSLIFSYARLSWVWLVLLESDVLIMNDGLVGGSKCSNR
jgi:hypothetical protein